MNWHSQEFFCDGGCRGNHKFGPREAYGSISDGQSVQRLEFSEAKSNNEAEFLTLIECLLNLPSDPKRPPTIYMDSALVVNILTKGWNCKASNLKDLAAQAHSLVKLKSAKLVWIPRAGIEKQVGH